MQCSATDTGIPNSHCAILLDDGDVLSPIGTVHSRNKQLVGRRVAAGLAAALYGAPTLPTGGAGPTYAGAALSSAPNGTLTATVSFSAESLGGAALQFNPPHASQWSNSSRCPSELGIIKEQDCGFFGIWDSAGVTHNASASLLPGGSQLLLVAQAPAGTRAVGTAWGWNAWPVVSFYNAAGLPMVPWNFSSSS
jgi:hypothetical protein